MTAIIELDQVIIHAGGRDLCGPLSLTLHSGDRLGILGQNGTGKTTLLHTLMRLHEVSDGEIRLLDKSLQERSGLELARLCGLLFQRERDQMPASVYETVMLGRFPHQQNWRWESEQDHRMVEQSLQVMALQALADRDITSLSGGERQRVAIAALLAQQPAIYLLDEPSNHLDVAFQMSLLACLLSVSQEQQTAVIVATHDINLAARLCNKILLLGPGGEHRFGPSSQILTEALLSAAFGYPIRQVCTCDGMLFYPAAPCASTT